MSASSGTTLISPTNSTTHPPAPQRKHSRASSHHSVHHSHHGTHRRAHGHGHAHAHGSHTSAQKSVRRSSEGESGRRALAAGLTMHVLDAATKAKQNRKTSEPNVHVTKPLTKGTNSKSESNLPSLSRVASTSSLSTTSGTGSGKKKRGSQDAGQVVEVIAGDAGSGDGSGEQDEWESGEDTPAGGNSRRMTPATRTRMLAGERAREQAERERAERATSPLLPPPPDHEPPATQKVSGFPGTPAALTPVSQPSSGVSSRHPSRPASSIALSRPASSANLTTGSTEQKDAGFPFPDVTSSDASTGDDEAAKITPKPPAAPAFSPEEQQQICTSPEEEKVTAGLRTPPAPSPAAAIRHRPSQTSLRSMCSFRAPPHPLNSLGLVESSPRRIASLHQTPMAEAVVYRETVEGQGFDNEGRPATRELPPPPSQPQRVGSFSSMRSLKDILVGAASPANSLPASRRPQTQLSLPQPRRLTAMQAASAVARLNTTNDPVAYHQSLGFSPATAETAHLLSRFLPSRKKHRPRWAITAKEAMAAHDAAMAGEEPAEPGRIGLTDGQYRLSHESLVETLKALGRRRGRFGIAEGDKGRTPFEMSAQRCLAQRPRVY